MSRLCFVVPIYKVPLDYLHKCVDSILAQKLEDIQVILVDDGSPDRCGEVCDLISSKDARVDVIHKSNGGLSDARNAGLRACTSEWITFVDGDDWVDVDFGSYFFEHIKNKENSDFYMFSGYRNYPNNEMTCTPYYDSGTVFCTQEQRENLQLECCAVPNARVKNRLFIGSAWAKVYRTEFLKTKGLVFPIVPYGEDSIFFFYSVEAANRIEYVDKCVYHYRNTQGGLVNGYRKDADEEQKLYVSALLEFAKQHNKKESFIDAIYLRAFIAIQRGIDQKFYNKNNRNYAFSRWRECNRFIYSEPMLHTFEHIKFDKLNNSGKIKYILVRLRLYSLYSIVKRVYLKKQNRDMFTES